MAPLGLVLGSQNAARWAKGSTRVKILRTLIIGTVVLAGAAQAQTPLRIAPRFAGSNPGVRQVDPMALLQSRLLRLEHKVNALQSTINKTQPALTFQCADGTTSRNSVGVSEDCTPYACAPIDGRCRVTSKTSADCAPGFYWIEGGSCVPPDPPG